MGKRLLCEIEGDADLKTEDEVEVKVTVKGAKPAPLKADKNAKPANVQEDTEGRKLLLG